MQNAIAAASAPVTLDIAGQRWQFSITGITRVGRELFISVMLQGADVCTAVVHVRDRVVLGITARAILDRACEWLLDRKGERHTFIELDDVVTSRKSASHKSIAH